MSEENFNQRLEKALKLNKSNLDDNILEFAEIYHFLTNRYLKLLNKINEVEIKLQERFAERYSYYKVDYEIQLTSQEIKMFIDNDKETQDLRLELKNLKSLAEVTEKQMKNIELARWDAKNLIEYMKLKSGII